MSKRKLKILQICNTDFYLNIFLSELVIELTLKGYEVDCICEGEEISPRLRKNLSRLIYFDYPKVSSIFLFLKAIFKMYKIIKQGNYDLVNTHNRNASIVGRIACFFAQKPLNVYTAHGFYFHDAQSKFAYKITFFLERLMSLTSDFIMSQSNEDTLLMIDSDKSLKSKILTIGNGVDIDRFYTSSRRLSDEKKLNLSSNIIRLVCVGRIVKNKGYEDILKAISEIDCEIELLIVGGNIKQEKNSIISELNLIIDQFNMKNIVITGLVDNVEDYLAVSDIFISASYREGVPRSVLEAQAASLPVIATKIRGNKEIVIDNLNGYLYEKGNYKELARLIQILSKDREKRVKYGAEARKIVESHNIEKEYVKRQVEIIGNLL